LKEKREPNHQSRATTAEGNVRNNGYLNSPRKGIQRQARKISELERPHEAAAKEMQLSQNKFQCKLSHRHIKKFHSTNYTPQD